MHRYVDDTFVILNNKNQADNILKYLNDQHQTIKFTMELESNNKINFLDVLVRRSSELKFMTSTYKKPTNTGNVLNWHSLTTTKYKTGLIWCFLNRSERICSTEEQRIIERNELREILLRNNYPSHIIEREFNRFTKRKQQVNVDKTINPDEKIKYLSLPYINDKSEISARKIQTLVKDFFPNIKLRIAFKSPATIANHFPYKDVVNDPKKRSGVVYRYKCKHCDASYIGMTSRILENRGNEHKKNENSHVYQHNILDNHEIDYENVEILDRANTPLKLSYKEMLYIRKLKPTLNVQKDSELFTLIISNVQLESSITRDIQKYIQKNNIHKHVS